MAKVEVVGDVESFKEAVHSQSTEEYCKFAVNKEDLAWEAVGDGNLNDVVRIYANQNREQSVIIKFAPPFIKCLGPDYPLGAQRGATEYAALKKFFLLCPGCCPQPFSYDPEKHIICMEDLTGYTLMRQQLISGVCSEESIVNIARDIANVHRDTHVGKLNDSDFKDLKEQFGHTDLVSLTEMYVFTFPFDQNEKTNRCSDEVKRCLNLVYEDEQVMSASRRMKQLFLEKKECLLHGDLHTGSIMVKGSYSKMIDLEFACVGPGAFDVGVLVANYIFSYYSHMSTEEKNDEHRKFAYSIINICKTTVNTYFEHMTSYTGDRNTYKDNFMSEVAGFTGCEIIRRIIGAAHVEDFNGHPAAEADCLQAGVRLLKAVDNIKTSDRLMVIALMLI